MGAMKWSDWPDITWEDQSVLSSPGGSVPPANLTVNEAGVSVVPGIRYVLRPTFVFQVYYQAAERRWSANPLQPTNAVGRVTLFTAPLDIM